MVALRVPPGFLWGTATAAYQVEGNCANTDLWASEFAEGSPYREHSGDAVDHYHRWPADLSCLKRLGLNALHLSIEWSRIEPESGCFSNAALIHYREVLQSCHELDLSPIVTLHHTVSPRWLIREGGWRSPRLVAHFQRYCAHVMRALGDWMPMVVPIHGMNGPQRLAQAQPWVGLAAEPATAAWSLHAARACGSEGPFHPFWLAGDDAGRAVIEAAHAAARDTIRWLRPTVRVGRSWLLDAQTAAPLPDSTDDDFLCLSVLGPGGAADAAASRQVLEQLDAQGVACRRWLLTDHAAAEAGAAQGADTMARALQQLQDMLDAGLPLCGWLYPYALPAWQGLNGTVAGQSLLAVDRASQQRQVTVAARALGQSVKSAEVAYGRTD